MSLLAILAVLAVPGAARATPLPSVQVLFGLPPGPTTNAGDETEYTITFTAPNGLDSAPGTAVVVNAAGAPPFAAGTVFPPSALHDDEGAFYTVGTAADPGNVVVANVIRQNGNQTVIIPTAFTGINVAPGSSVTVGIGYVSEHKVQNRRTPCDDCVLAVDTTMPGDDFGLSAPFDVVEGPGDLVVEAGSNQSTTVGTPFATRLRARLTDGLGNPVAGATVTFAAPAGGPSGTFADGGGLTDDELTNADGVARSSELTASGTAGPWSATATSDAPGVNGVSFALENEAGPPAAVDLVLSPKEIPGNGVSKSEATATVTDAFANPVPGRTVTFSSDGDQAISRTQELTGGRYRATITATPESQVATITADVAGGSAPSDTALLLQTLDETAPRARIVDHPDKRSPRRRAEFTFRTNAGDTDFLECKLDRAPFRRCQSPKIYRVERGGHSFRVRATDFAGNSGPADAFRFRRTRRD